MGAVLLSDQVTPDPQAVERAAAVLREGGVVVLPTDSVYGICCAATAGNPAHTRIFDIKRRDRAQTLPWFIADVCDLERYGHDVPAWALRLAERSWPGALTVVVRASEAVPPEYAQPSASGSGLEPGIVEAADLVVDAGPAPVGVASTIVDATGAEPRILRTGALAEAEVLLALR